MFATCSFFEKNFRCCTALLLGVLWCPCTQALDRNTSIRHFGRRIWQTDEGLPQNSVTAILQTKDGYLWFATEGGLARFDGIQFTVFNRRNTPQLHSNQINSLYQDAQGVLWIGTSDGLTSFDGSRWAVYTQKNGLPDNNISSVLQDRQGVLWVVTADGLARNAQGKITSVTTSDGLPSGSVLSLAGDNDGTIWVATTGGIGKANRDRIVTVYRGEVSALVKNPTGGLVAATQQGFAAIKHGELSPFFKIALGPDANVETLFAAQDGSLWMGTSTGLTVWKQSAVEHYTVKEGLPSNSIHAVYQDREGSVWVSTDRGLARFIHGAMQVFTTQEGLSAPLVLSIYEDREGSLWLGTDAGGVTMLRNQKFISYTATDGLAGDNTKAVFQDRDGAVWIGTDGNGLSKFEQHKFTTIDTKDGLSSDIVLALAGDSQAGMWVGTPDGLNHLVKKEISHVTSADGLEDDFIRSLLEDTDSSLWVGTRHGLTNWKNSHATTYTKLDGLSSDFIGALEKDKDGNLWIGTLEGLNQRRDEKFLHYTVRQGLSNNVITALFADAAGVLWIGTKGGGLDRWQNGKLFIYDARTAIPENIYGILADDSGSLWISSDRGIFRASIAELNAYADGHMHTVAISQYGTADGMPTSQCSSGGHPTVWKSLDGTLWFTTPRGITSIQPEQAAFNKVPPPVAIEQVSIDDAIAPSDKTLIIAPGHTRYAFRYAGLSFIAPQNVRFRYRLVGFDKTWIDAGTRRQAYYTNLKPGKYRFQVLAENNDNVWNDTGASFYFVVEPHVYQTGWFYLVVCFLVCLLAYELYRLRIHQVRTQFQAVLAERNRIAREIHDTLAQGFVGVSLQLEIAKRILASSNQTVKGHLEQAIALVNTSLTEARRSIWDLRSQASEDGDIPARLTEVVKQIRNQSTSEIVLTIQGAYRKITDVAGNELLRIAQESTINAIRHSGAHQIRVALSYGEASIRLTVSDNGQGFTSEKQAQAHATGHYGLTGMEERAKLIHARLKIESSPNSGTTISLEIPE